MALWMGRVATTRKDRVALSQTARPVCSPGSMPMKMAMGYSAAFSASAGLFMTLSKQASLAFPTFSM